MVSVCFSHKILSCDYNSRACSVLFSKNRTELYFYSIILFFFFRFFSRFSFSVFFLVSFCILFSVCVRLYSSSRIYFTNVVWYSVAMYFIGEIVAIAIVMRRTTPCWWWFWKMLRHKYLYRNQSHEYNTYHTPHNTIENERMYDCRMPTFCTPFFQ